MIAVWFKIDGERLVPALQEAREKLDAADGEIHLDFSSVARMDVGGVRAVEQLAAGAEEKKVKVVLRGVSVDVYKVLKLMKLTPRFSFVS